MPHPLLKSFVAEAAKEKKSAIDVGGVYCISTAESRFWRHEHGAHAKAWKIGKSWDLMNRLNSYLTSNPFLDQGGVQLHCVLLMDHQTNEHKNEISKAESFVLEELKKQFPQKSHWPGIDNLLRSSFSRSEWVEDVSLKAVQEVFQQAEAAFPDTRLVVGGNNVPREWVRWKAALHTKKYKEQCQKRMREEADTKLQAAKAAKKRMTESIYNPKKYC